MYLMRSTWTVSVHYLLNCTKAVNPSYKLRRTVLSHIQTAMAVSLYEYKFKWYIYSECELEKLFFFSKND